MNQTPREAFVEAVRAKKERRHRLADLPFDEKVEIVVKLQQMAFEIATAAGRPARKPWNVRR